MYGNARRCVNKVDFHDAWNVHRAGPIANFARVLRTLAESLREMYVQAFREAEVVGPRLLLLSLSLSLSLAHSLW